jgi:hypothetical protein
MRDGDLAQGRSRCSGMQVSSLLGTVPLARTKVSLDRAACRCVFDELWTARSEIGGLGRNFAGGSY